MESRRRSLVKALTWRAGGLVVTALIALLLTGSWRAAASIGLLDTLVKLAAFYVHERMWLKIRFGRLRAVDYEI